MGQVPGDQILGYQSGAYPRWLQARRAESQGKRGSRREIADPRLDLRHAGRGDPGDLVDLVVRVAPPGVQQSRRALAEMGTFDPDRDCRLGGSEPDYPLSRDTDMEQHARIRPV